MKIKRFNVLFSQLFYTSETGLINICITHKQIKTIRHKYWACLIQNGLYLNNPLGNNWEVKSFISIIFNFENNVD